MKRPFAAVALALVALLLPPGCASESTSDRDIEFVNPEEAWALSRGERKSLLQLGSKTAVWIDPRSPAAYGAERLPGAINLTLDAVKAGDDRLKGYDILIVYGDDYNSPLALAMSKALLRAGYEVRTLRGGLRAWKQAGNEVEGTAAGS